MTDDTRQMQFGEEELARSSLAFLTEVERLAGLERRKRDMAPDDPARPGLAREIEDVTAGLLGMGRYQTRLIELEAQRQGIGLVAEPRKASVVIEEWRQAERDLFEARRAMERASDATHRLREEHRRSFGTG
jgi:hypothetical protein